VVVAFATTLQLAVIPALLLAAPLLLTLADELPIPVVGRLEMCGDRLMRPLGHMPVVLVREFPVQVGAVVGSAAGGHGVAALRTLDLPSRLRDGGLGVAFRQAQTVELTSHIEL
jgi:hypothetical protein